MSTSRVGLRNVRVDRVHQLADALAGFRIRRILVGRQGRAADDRNVVAGELVLGQQLAEFHLDQLEQLRIVDQVDLVQEHTMAGTSTWRASRTCSRVCGIGPSAADTTRIAPSIWAAPVIMFLMKSAWPGQSMWA